MIAGLFGLVFNPSAWVALGLAAMLAFSGGFVRGYGYANSQKLAAEIDALRSAIAVRDRIAKGHAVLLEEHAAEAERLKTEIEGLVHANQDAGSACLLSAVQLAELRRIATSAER